MTGYQEPNYTQTPNALFDLDMRDMSAAELKVTLVIVRKIIGYHKDKPEAISYSQMQEFTGLSRQAVRDGVKAALKRGRIKLASKKGPRGVNMYTINLVQQSTQETSSSQLSRPVLVNSVDTQKKASKETIQKKKDSAATPPAIQPHIALIDAYWAALPGGKPIKDDYPRHVKLATKMVDAGVTTEQIVQFMTALYDPKTDVFEYKRWHDKVIPLENVAELLPVWWAKHKPKPVQRYVLNGPANFQEHFEKRMREINSDEGQQQIKDYLVAQGRGHEFNG